jgi:hypothetical protein
VQREPRRAVSVEVFLSLAAGSDAATLEGVTGLCDVAVPSAPCAALSRAVNTRRGGRITRAAYVRPRARAGENTRVGFDFERVARIGLIEQLKRGIASRKTLLLRRTRVGRTLWCRRETRSGSQAALMMLKI